MGVRVREKVPGSGVWWIFVKHKGRRASRLVGTQQAAETAQKQIEARLALGEWLPQEKKDKERAVPTLKAYYEGLEDTREAGLAENTCLSYERSFRLHILPELGDLDLDEITRERVKKFVGHLAQKTYTDEVWERYQDEQGRPQRRKKTVERKYSKDSIRIILAGLTTVLEQAREDELIKVNPSGRLGKLYKQAQTVNESINPFTREEVPVFLKSVQAHSPNYYALFLCALHTGLRSSELAGLEWGHIDFNGKFIQVSQQFVRGRLKTLKTKKSRRRVDLSDELIETLKAHRRKLKETWLSKGSNEVSKWAFPNELGEPINMNIKARHHFEKCLSKAGLRHLRLHDLRHTFATLLLMQNESLVYVKEQLGHSSITMTVDTYAHWIPGSNRQAVNRLPGLGKGSAKVKTAKAGK